MKLQVFFTGLFEQPYSPCTIPSLIATFVGYLTSAPLTQLEPVVAHLVGTIAALFSARSLQDAFLHNILRYTAFVAHLIHSSSVATRCFIELGFLDHILGNIYPDAPLVEKVEWQQLHTRCLLVIGAVATHVEYREILQLSLYKYRKNLAHIVKTTVPDILSVQLCLRVSGSGYIDLAPNLAPFLPSHLPSPIPDGPRFVDNPWYQLIACFTSYFEDTQTPGSPGALRIKHATEQFMLLAATVPEESWEPVTKILLGNPPGSASMYAYIITSYLGCSARNPDRSDIELPADRLNFLQRISMLARDFEVTHPVDRWIMFASRATNGQRRPLMSVGMDNMLRLLKEVESGSYDVVLRPTFVQLAARAKECDWMRFQITSLQNDYYED